MTEDAERRIQCARESYGRRDATRWARRCCRTASWIPRGSSGGVAIAGPEQPPGPGVPAPPGRAGLRAQAHELSILRMSLSRALTLSLLAIGGLAACQDNETAIAPGDRLWAGSSFIDAMADYPPGSRSGR